MFVGDWATIYRAPPFGKVHQFLHHLCSDVSDIPNVVVKSLFISSLFLVLSIIVLKIYLDFQNSSLHSRSERICLFGSEYSYSCWCLIEENVLFIVSLLQTQEESPGGLSSYENSARLRRRRPICFRKYRQRLRGKVLVVPALHSYTPTVFWCCLKLGQLYVIKNYTHDIFYKITA